MYRTESEVHQSSTTSRNRRERAFEVSLETVEKQQQQSHVTIVATAGKQWRQFWQEDCRDGISQLLLFVVAVLTIVDNFTTATIQSSSVDNSSNSWRHSAEDCRQGTTVAGWTITICWWCIRYYPTHFVWMMLAYCPPPLPPSHFRGGVLLLQLVEFEPAEEGGGFHLFHAWFVNFYGRPSPLSILTAPTSLWKYANPAAICIMCSLPPQECIIWRTTQIWPDSSIPTFKKSDHLFFVDFWCNFFVPRRAVYVPSFASVMIK